LKKTKAADAAATQHGSDRYRCNATWKGLIPLQRNMEAIDTAATSKRLSPLQHPSGCHRCSISILRIENSAPSFFKLAELRRISHLKRKSMLETLVQARQKQLLPGW